MNITQERTTASVHFDRKIPCICFFCGK